MGFGRREGTDRVGLQQMELQDYRLSLGITFAACCSEEAVDWSPSSVPEGAVSVRVLVGAVH